MFENEKQCILMDEISIDKHLDKGFHDVSCLSRGERLAKKALVIMCAGLYSKWKISFVYFLCTSVV